MIITQTTIAILGVVASLFIGAAFATDQTSDIAADSSSNIGFLSDYSVLQPSPNNQLMRYYLAPGAKEKLASYHSIMVDHPEVFVATDSPYRGFKPAQLTVIVEAFRQAVTGALADDYTVVEQPGPGVMYLRLALVDLNVHKDRVHILGFTPVGLTYKAGRKMLASDYDNAVRHTSLVNVKIEGEVRDSQSSEILGEFVNAYGGKATTENWNDILVQTRRAAATIACQFKNGQSAENQQKNCRADD